jgi:hypothetical protein
MIYPVIESLGMKSIVSAIETVITSMIDAIRIESMDTAETMMKSMTVDTTESLSGRTGKSTIGKTAMTAAGTETMTAKKSTRLAASDQQMVRMTMKTTSTVVPRVGVARIARKSQERSGRGTIVNLHQLTVAPSRLRSMRLLARRQRLQSSRSWVVAKPRIRRPSKRAWHHQQDPVLPKSYFNLRKDQRLTGLEIALARPGMYVRIGTGMRARGTGWIETGRVPVLEISTKMNTLGVDRALPCPKHPPHP